MFIWSIHLLHPVIRLLHMHQACVPRLDRACVYLLYVGGSTCRHRSTLVYLFVYSCIPGFPSPPCHYYIRPVIYESITRCKTYYFLMETGLRRHPSAWFKLGNV